MVAGSIREVGEMLRAEGKYPTKVHAASDEAAKTAPAAGIKIARADVIQISQQLSIMVETGVTITEALDCIAAQSEKPPVKKLLEDLSQQVQGGSDFSSALARHPRSFPRLFVALIKASEKSGMMGKLLTRATTYMRDEQETLRRVKGALTYPGIMLAFAITTTIFLLAFVLPKFTSIYAAKAAALPLPTKFLMGASDFITGHYIVLASAVFMIAGGGWLIMKTARGQRSWHFLQLRLPLMGKMYRKLHLSRGLRMLGTMAGAGVNLVDCVTTAEDLCTNSYYRALWHEVGVQIQSGRQFSEPLFENALVPKAIAQMLHSGEKSGKLAFVMEHLAGFTEQELKETIADMTRYIEPIMITVMGAIIGTVALALMLPIFTISRVMTK
jgi:type IV pilus assembly protein PilC